MAEPSHKHPAQDDALALARALLVRPKPLDAAWPALAAATIFAASALTFATIVVLAPAP